MYGLLELLFVEELKDEKNQFSAQRRHLFPPDLKSKKMREKRDFFAREIGIRVRTGEEIRRREEEEEQRGENSDLEVEISRV